MNGFTATLCQLLICFQDNLIVNSQKVYTIYSLKHCCHLAYILNLPNNLSTKYGSLFLLTQNLKLKRVAKDEYYELDPNVIT